MLEDGPLQTMTDAQLENVIAPKWRGAWNLHMATLSSNLDFFIMQSSIASMLGNIGQGNHAGANAALDSLAHARRQAGLTALSVNWGYWAEVGAAADHRDIRDAIGRIHIHKRSAFAKNVRHARLTCYY